MNPEYEAIAKKYGNMTHVNSHDLMRCAILDCAELADKPQVRLSRTELIRVYSESKDSPFLAIQEAILAAQREPESIPFDYSLWIQGGWEPLLSGCPVDAIRNDCNYTMRKK